MDIKLEKVRFKGKDYALEDRLDSPLGTVEQHRHLRESFAFVCEDGKVRRYGQVIGTADEIEYSGEYIEIELAKDAACNLLHDLTNLV